MAVYIGCERQQSAAGWDARLSRAGARQRLRLLPGLLVPRRGASQLSQALEGAMMKRSPAITLYDLLEAYGRVIERRQGATLTVGRREPEVHSAGRSGGRNSVSSKPDRSAPCPTSPKK